MKDEMRMWLCGTECELRPLSAERFIGIKSGLSQETKDAEIARIIFAAHLIAEGAYDGEKKMFSSGAEVLKKLTAGEIMEAGEFYLLPEEKAESDKGGGDERQTRGVSEEAVYGGNAQKTVYEMSVSEQGGHESLEASGVKSGKKITTSEKFEESVRVLNESPEARRAGKSDMRGISEFFERDSRRYGAAFERY